MSPAEALDALACRPLTRDETAAVFRRLASGGMDDLQAAALLAALKTRGETAEGIRGAAGAMLEAARPFVRPEYLFADCCGTGGDRAGTVNVSTAVAFVAATAGLPIAKHGNHAVSSRCGSADVLRALGAVIEIPPEAARRSLDECGVCYLHAPQYHPAAGRVATVRRALGTRTVFNLLGPLLNPSRPPVRLVGVYAAELVLPTARALAYLGCEAGLVVHGGGLDEIALHSSTVAARIAGDEVVEMTLSPAEAGVPPAPLAALRGGGPEENARWLRDLLAGRGEPGPVAAVALNAGALLWIAGRARGLREGTAEARAILLEGRAAARLECFVEMTRRA